jgi:hypothetical protein
MSDSFKVRERCSVEVVSARTDISSASASGSSATPQCSVVAELSELADAILSFHSEAKAFIATP